MVIEHFSDFQCPFCNRVVPTVEQVRQRYGDRVRLVWRNYPLRIHDNAMVAAEAMEGANRFYVPALPIERVRAILAEHGYRQ
mgnify:CR=1 FL=1